MINTYMYIYFNIQVIDELRHINLEMTCAIILDIPYPHGTERVGIPLCEHQEDLLCEHPLCDHPELLVCEHTGGLIPIIYFL